MKVIGLSAKMQGGKTTATNAIIKHFCGLEYNYTIHEISFARFLKEIVARCFFGVPKFTENMKEAMVSGKSGREWLQIVGTDWFREAHATCWVNSAQAAIEEILGCTIEEELAGDGKEAIEKLFVISDVRFENELKFVQDIGGHVIRLLRNTQPDCTHESEKALDIAEGTTKLCTTHEFSPYTLVFDALIDNKDMSLEEKNVKVIEMVGKLLGRQE